MRRRTFFRLTFVGGAWTPIVDVEAAEDDGTGAGETGGFDAADEQRRQLQIDRMLEMSEQREQIREAQLQKLTLMSAMRPSTVDGQRVQAEEPVQKDILKIVQEAAQALRQKQELSRLRANFNDATEKPFVEKPTKALDNFVNGWNESVAPSCDGMRAVSNFVGDFCQGVSAFTQQYAFMLNANDKTMVPRCDVRGAVKGSYFENQDKYRHCMANCESAEVGRTGEIVARSISLGREITDVAVKPAAAAMQAYDRQRSAKVDLLSSALTAAKTYSSALSAEYAASKDDMKANNLGASAPAKGLRCRDACAGYRPFYITPKP